MYKHRRSPSYTKDDSCSKSAGGVAEGVKQSDGRLAIKGTFSSASNTECDSVVKKRGKKKPNSRLENLAELEEALRLTLDSKQDFSPDDDEV